MHTFPYTVQNPLTREQVTVSNDDDLKSLFALLCDREGPDWGATLYTFASLTICYYKLWDSWVNEMIERFYYCREWNTRPFPGAYDDHPASWKEVSKFIGTTESEIRDCSCAQHKPKVAHG